MSSFIVTFLLRANRYTYIYFAVLIAVCTYRYVMDRILPDFGNLRYQLYLFDSINYVKESNVFGIF